MRTFVRILTVTLALWSAVPARAQSANAQPPPSPYVDARDGLGLDDAIRRALEREPGIRGARTEVDIARGLRQQAGLRPNPTLSFEHRAEPGGTDRLTTVGVEWPLDLWRRQGRIATADREIAAIEFAVTDRERMLAAEVRDRYGAAAAAARDVQVAEDLVATSERHLALVRARAEAGATPPLQADLIEVELRRLQAEHLLAVGRANAMLVRLKQSLGMAPEEPLLLRATLEDLAAANLTDATTATPSTIARADVRQAEARIATAEARLDQARREGRLDVSVFGNYMRMDAGFPQLGFTALGTVERVRGQFNYLAAGAMLTVPLFNRNQGQVAAAQAERSGAVARHQAAELGARAEVAAARARESLARRAVALYSNDIRTLARQNLDVVNQTFELGRATVFDVLTERRRYLEIEQGYTNALREAWEAHADLKRALGELK